MINWDIYDDSQLLLIVDMNNSSLDDVIATVICLSTNEIMLKCDAVWWHQEMYVALIHHLYGSFKVWHWQNAKGWLVKGEIPVHDACVHANFCIWFIPTICSKQMHMPGCTFMLALSMCFVTPGLFNRVGSASFISCLALSLKREKPCSLSWEKSDDMTVLADRHWDSLVWLTLLVTLS